MTKSTELPTAFNGTIYVMMSVFGHSIGKLSALGSDISNLSEYIKVGQQDIHILLDDSLDMRQAAIASLKEQQQDNLANVHKSNADIQANIDELLLIGYDPIDVDGHLDAQDTSSQPDVDDDEIPF